MRADRDVSSNDSGDTEMRGSVDASDSSDASGSGDADTWRGRNRNASGDASAKVPGGAEMRKLRKA